MHRVVRALLQLQGRGLSDDDDADASTNQDQRRHLSLILQKMANRAVAICDPGTVSKFFFSFKKKCFATLLTLVF